MNRNTGMFGTIALALATAFGLFFMPSGKGEPTTTGSAQTGSATENGPAPQPVKQKLLAPCREVGERISEFVSDGSVKPPTSCFEDPSKAEG